MVRDVVAVPVALVCYVIAVVLISLFCQWFFDRPEDWPYLIPIITAGFSMAAAVGVAEEKFDSKPSAKVVAIIIAAFWVVFVIVDVAGGIQDLINFLAGKDPDPDALDVIMLYVDVLLNSKIFAVVSCLLAAGQNES